MPIKKTSKAKKSATSRARGTAMLKRRFPAHLSVDTPEEWRALKRTEWREVTQAIERFNHGSAYTPGRDALYALEIAARQVTEAIQSDGWIAW